MARRDRARGRAPPDLGGLVGEELRAARRTGNGRGARPAASALIPWRIAALAALGLAVVELAMLVAVDGNRVVHLLQRAAPSTASRLHGTRPVAATGHVRTGPVTPLRSRSRVSVLVLNGNGTTGAAGHAATLLLHHGYHAATAADASNHDYATSLVLYRPGWRREARRLAHDSGARIVAPLDGRLPGGSGHDQLVLILGR